MSYASLQDLIDSCGERLLVELTDRTDPPTGQIDMAVIDQKLTDTDAVIDSYLAGRYVLPLATTPPVLVGLAVAIALYKLHTYTPNAKIAEDYKDAVASLNRLSSGAQRLPVAGIEPPSSGASGVVATDRPRDFTPENMRGFI
ncbi:MAG: DUF1320 domain-containing protein [Sphingomonadales bacterium]|nr:DUF1320 domain-containing protein [Sphingomonadales bacterium]MDE2171330.1 DUF1320 domain-containing protein [Sphingomonadales bacterium]